MGGQKGKTVTQSHLKVSKSVFSRENYFNDVQTTPSVKTQLFFHKYICAMHLKIMTLEYFLQIKRDIKLA